MFNIIAPWKTMTDRHILPPYSLRMPADLREKLEASASDGKRSLNAEIVARLEASYEYVPSSRAISLEDGLSELQAIENQRLIIGQMKMAKFQARSALQDELEGAQSSELKAALEAALTATKAELDGLWKQEHELSESYYELRAQLTLNSKAPKDE
ncbi:Arc family DNA-binding protein [Pseudomonas mosselii]|uniref:Arc family DNA-binding protein n=1 Tax=Pseudomonas mosselii TaxID=78327 RepID=UPI002B0560FD|nr:Arc family DNA-binding protein [Pseudomonas mosselii]MEA3233915.1 Arc family DNA-binding protein [Pseudomonas mosselii]